MGHLFLNGLVLLAGRNGNPFFNPGAHHAAVCSQLSPMRGGVNQLLELVIVIGALVGVAAAIFHIVRGIFRAHHSDTPAHVGRAIGTIIVLLVALGFVISVVYLVAPANTLC